MHRFFTRFLRHEGGNVLMISGLMIVVLFAVTGAAVDLSRQQLVKNKLQQASDAASVAAAVLPPSAQESDRASTALRFFNLNYPSTYSGVARPTPQISIGSDIVVQATTPLPTSMMGSVGVVSMTSAGMSRVSRQAIAQEQKYDMILVMDVSGSMSSTDGGRTSRLNSLKSAASTLTGQMLGNAEGSAAAQKNRMAGVTWSDTVIGTQSFTNSPTAMQRFITGMSTRGGTNSASGMTQAQNYANNFRNDTIKAVILLTDGSNGANIYPRGTDDINTATLATCSALKSQNVQVYTIAFGEDVNGICNSYLCDTVINPFTGQPLRDSNGDPLETCRIETIRTGTTRYNATYCPKPFLLACASRAENYFEAPDAATLAAAFEQITQNVQKLRIVE